MYPESIQISPQSDELGKSLLLFKDELPVTDLALFHLAVYGFCKYTSKKVPHTEMTNWIDSHKNKIFQTAKDPYKNQDFLNEASDKYLFLAFCLSGIKFTSPKITHGPPLFLYMLTALAMAFSITLHFFVTRKALSQ